MRVVVTDADFGDLDPERAVFAAAGIEVVVADCGSPAEVVEAGRGASALLVQYAPVTAEVLDRLDDLRVISRYGVGVDTVDVEAATRRGVWVANVPDYGTQEVAAHTVGLLLGLVRHLPFHDRAVRAGSWDAGATGAVTRLSEMTLGLVGLGRIGRLVAERAGAWFGAVVAYDPYVDPDDWPDQVGRLATVAEVVATSHAISLHLPLTDHTRGLIDGDLLALAPAGGCYLVNTARGGLVDLDGLLAALDAGRVRAAALDVLPQEPPPDDHPLLAHPRVTVTPHVAWYSEQAAADLRRRAAENIVQWRDTGRPRTPVNQPVGTDT